MSLKYMKVTME